ncbi:hypothetical protein [Pluralibacter gergoviae]|uniref:hypothetical protein n=1 Tax=Pluralibacter gergoviae TaxID=61647 RepID=UPI00069DCB28|nr:hypothetical protein [Pluralibacter gergoviae]
MLKIDRRELIREAEVKDARIAELDCKLEQVRTQSSKWLEAYHKAVSVGARYEERIAELETYLEIHERAAVAAIERAEMADRRAVELQSRAEAAESRVVSVALPDLRQAVSGERYVWSDGVYNYAQDVRKILTAAGIQIQGGE